MKPLNRSKAKRSQFFLFLLFALLYQVNLPGQTFSCKIYFTDAQGNRDTIELGLDPQATIDIDSQFGEVNIMEEDYKEGIDVRITDRWFQNSHGNLETYHSKKTNCTFYCYLYIRNHHPNGSFSGNGDMGQHPICNRRYLGWKYYNKHYSGRMV